MLVKPSIEWSRISSSERDIISKHQVTAPVPVGAIASAFGMTVKVATLPNDISGEIRRVAESEAPAEFQIKVNRHDDKRRQRFTIAHEISHFLLHKDSIKDCLTDDVLYRSSLSNKLEAQANRLATDIIMPSHLLTQELSTTNSYTTIGSKITHLAHLFDVSEIAMQIRLGVGKTGR